MVSTFVGANYCWSQLHITIFSNRLFCLFPSTLVTSALQLAIDDDVITFDLCFDNGQDGLGNSLSSGGYFLSEIGQKYFKIPCSNIT